jgi:hypothetical protein
MTMTVTSPPAERVRRPAAAPDDIALLIARWQADRVPFVVVDGRGRHAGRLAAGRLDLTRAAVLDAHWVNATLHRTGYALLDAGNVSRVARPLALGRALGAVQRLRARTGQPTWLLVEDAQDLLCQPDIPPHALRFADGGYVLAVRDGATLPASVTGGAAFDVRSIRMGLEVVVIPPRAG